MPSKFEAEVGSRSFATSQPSGIPSPSVSQPSGSSSICPSPSSSSLEQSASPSPSGSKLSTKPSLSSSNVLKQILPTGSSSAPSEPVPCENCIALSSSQFLTGTVPFHHTPLSRTFAVKTSSHPAGMPYRYSFKFVKESPSGSPTDPFNPFGDSGSNPYCHSQPSGRPSLSLSQSCGCVLIMNSNP